MKKAFIITVLILVAQFSFGQQFTDLYGDYLGQTPPGDSAVKFAPGIISLSNRGEYEILFSSDGNECYFSCSIKDTLKTYYTKRINNSWTDQKEASFSVNNYNFALTSISADGKTIFLTKYNSTFSNGEILKVERTAEEWSEPQYLQAPINSSSDDGGYTETSDSVIYIDSGRPGSKGGRSNIWRMRYMPDKTIVAEPLGLIINSTPSNFSPCIARDGSYLIFTQSDGTYEHLCISFSKGKGNNEWTKPVDMDKSGAGINKLFQISPTLSPDGKYLFYCSHDPASGNNSDIYWVSTHIIDTLKKIAMPTTLVNEAIDKKAMLYPNPTTGQISISFGGNQLQQAIAEVFNTEGKLLLAKTFQDTVNATIDLSYCPKGIYVLNLIIDGEIFNEKICLN